MFDPNLRTFSCPCTDMMCIYCRVSIESYAFRHYSCCGIPLLHPLYTLLDSALVHLLPQHSQMYWSDPLNFHRFMPYLMTFETFVFERLDLKFSCLFFAVPPRVFSNIFLRPSRPICLILIVVSSHHFLRLF